MTEPQATAPQQTPLYDLHLQQGAKIVDFGGWALPVNYGSQIDEHHAVRNRCGMFDVSHMTVSDIEGADTLPYLRHLLANDIDKVASQAGKALYSCMLNDDGGVIDDLIVYYLSDTHCRLVTNAGTRDKDLQWMQQQSEQFEVSLSERPELALIAVQGPDALGVCAESLNEVAPSLGPCLAELQRFQGAWFEVDGQQEFVGRTGYTGEDGVEFIVSAALARQMWSQLSAAGVAPCGLGARDTLRLEAGMALYGNDLDEQHSPLESGLNWTVSMQSDREFIGRAALEGQPRQQIIGLILQDRGVLRGHQPVHSADENGAIGEVTSGTFSPTLEQSIGLARVRADADLNIGDTVLIEVRNKQLKATVSKYPFVKNGQPTNA
ncbi:MAG: glycine cleavage system aminomethyltransferase GcvT [Gammaproteobacteria bacterium]|nr:glycine cleavage system aminomethyltransferase GcvT [Gammaproteobacteria bacterium]